jgi:hypothetical protein
MLLTYLIAFPSILLQGFAFVSTSQLMTTKADMRAKQSDANTDLICSRCQEERCRPMRKQMLNCRGGYTLDICNCCPTCAMVDGDFCGGDYQMFGKCDRGLVCRPNDEDAKRYGVYKNPIGRCERGKFQLFLFLLPTTQAYKMYSQYACDKRESRGAMNPYRYICQKKLFTD